jgi:ketosteroid isomerase-like protein
VPEKALHLTAYKAAMLIGLGMVLGVGCVGLLQQIPKARGNEEPAIRQVLEAQVRAWNSGDIDGFMEGYWQSESLTFRSGGTTTLGYEATKSRYKKRYQTPGSEMGNLTFSEIQVELLGTEAIVTGAWKLVRLKDQPQGLFTLRLRKMPEGWKIISDHTSAAE